MKTLFAILLTASVLFYSCKKDKEINESMNGQQYEKGTLYVGIHDTIQINKVFDLFNSLNFQIVKIGGYYYYSGLPADSVNYLIGLYNQKAYINSGSFKATTSTIYYHEPAGKIKILCNLFDMNLNNQADFIKTANELNLSDFNNNSKNVLIKIPEGTEEYWLNELKKYSIIKLTELNSIRQNVLN